MIVLVTQLIPLRFGVRAATTCDACAAARLPFFRQCHEMLMKVGIGALAFLTTRAFIVCVLGAQCGVSCFFLGIAPRPFLGIFGVLPLPLSAFAALVFKPFLVVFGISLATFLLILVVVAACLDRVARLTAALMSIFRVLITMELIERLVLTAHVASLSFHDMPFLRVVSISIPQNGAFRITMR